MSEKLPHGQLVLFTLCNIANGLSISVQTTQAMYPYASNMVMDFGLTEDRSSTGYYAGFLCGGVMIGRAIGAPFWGWFADKYGRKPVLLISLLSVAIGSLVLGCAQNFVTAVGALFFSGLFCTLGAVCKTCVSEVTPKPLQAKAMSCYALGWYYGQMAGYSVGGLLVHPEKTGIATEGVLVDFPYLLPNLVCSGIALVSLIGVIFCFTETLPAPKPTPVPKFPGSTQSSTPFSFLKSTQVTGVFSMYSLQVFCNTGFIETFPLWCWSSKEHGGVNFDPHEIGTTLTVSYIAMICVQSFLYSRMVGRLGLIGVVRGSSLVLIPVLVALPLIGVFQGSEAVLKGLLVAGCLVYYLFGFNIYTSIFVLTNNAVRQRDRAKVNGCSMGFGYVVRGVTPLVVGYAFAYTSQHGSFYPFDYHFVFTMLAVGMLVEAVIAMRLPRRLENPAEEEYIPVSNEASELELTVRKT